MQVKNKKRWSQVMYMSYVLDFKIKQMGVLEEDTYILTTDADVRFDADSVEALLDRLIRDPNVGAVCGRTHPLGHGPLVWYQMFDYAIGHWFQKVANHVLGSVLCCPGCFSVYRAKALRDVLGLYSTTADHAVDFLTKDMGEDRWLCTLMVQAGWRLEYCAAAENFTYCPDNFDEFYKQRRRWIPSTLANLALLISEYDMTCKNNDSMSFMFILYQASNVFSTLI
ncbi:Chitin synthase 6, partial [Paramuricea clavata]